MVESIIAAPPPKYVEKIVCRLCHRLKDVGAEWCKFCPGKTVTDTTIDGVTVRKIVHGGCAHLGHHAATEGVAVRREDRTRAFAAPATLNIWQPLAFAL